MTRAGRLANMRNQFFILNAQIKTNKGINLITLERFDARLAEISVQMDDELLNHLYFFMSQITEKIEIGFSEVHPIFFKNSFYDKLDPNTE